MMKTTTCAFCGQELRKGNGGNKKELYLGFTTLDCCPHCHQKYSEFVEKDNYRFESKMKNVYHTAGKIANLAKMLTREEIVTNFLRYYEESKSYDLNRTFNFFLPVEDVPVSRITFYLASRETYFNIPVQQQTVLDEVKEENNRLLGARLRAEDYIPAPAWPFGPEDISCLEYTYSTVEEDEVFREISLQVKFNDSRQITYRPCVTSGIVLCPVDVPDIDTYVDQHIALYMLNLRTALQVEHLPIIKRSRLEFIDAGQMPATQKPQKPGFMELPVVEKVVNFFEGVAESFHTLRIICCFLPLLATIGLIVMIWSNSTFGVSFFGFCEFVSILSTLIACPGRCLGTIGKLTLSGFTIGMFFAFVGCIIGAGVGLALGVALFLYVPAVVTIPYCFKNLLAN